MATTVIAKTTQTPPRPQRGERARAFIHLRENPSDALFFDFYPDKQSMSGGTHVGVKPTPGWNSDVVHPRGRKSVEQKLSLIFNSWAEERYDDDDFVGAEAAIAWVMRNLGPGGRSDTSNVFMLKVLDQRQLVVIESWGAELLQMNMLNEVFRFRLDLGMRHYAEVRVDPALFPKAKKKVKDRKLTPSLRELGEKNIRAMILGGGFLPPQFSPKVLASQTSLRDGLKYPSDDRVWTNKRGERMTGSSMWTYPDSLLAGVK